MRKTLRVWAAGLLAAVVPACGSGDSDGAPPPGPGDLAAGFGAGGVVLEDPAAGIGYVSTLELDGAVLFTGGFHIPAGGGPGSWKVEKRNASDGALIASFDGDGILLVPTQGGLVDLVVAGTSLYLVGAELVGVPGGLTDMRWRIEKRSAATGALDGGFGTGGVVLSDPSGYYDIPHAAAADGTHLYVVGIDSVPFNPAGANRTRWRIEKRRLDNGDPDAGFGAAGVVVIAQTDRVDEAFDVLLAGGSLYVGGFQTANSTGQWRIEKRDPVDGDLDPGFGVGGAVLSDLTVNHDEVRCLASDGASLFAAGVEAQIGGDRWRIERRSLTDGALIGAFGTSGAVVSDPSPDYDSPEALVADAAGLYVAGRDSSVAFNDVQWRLEKRSPVTGALDPVFNGGAAFTQNPSAFNDFLAAAALDAAFLYLGGSHGRGGGGQDSWRIEKRHR